MGNSLHEQLKKAGLVSDRQLQQAHKAKQKQEKLQRKRRKKGAASGQQVVQGDRAAAERDRALNRQRQEKARQKARAAEVRQLIERHRLKEVAGEIPYSFTDGKRIARLFVDETLRGKLIQGQVAIVRLGREYVLVPDSTAARIQERAPSQVLLWNRDSGEPAGEDPYADFKVPDDLMW